MTIFFTKGEDLAACPMKAGDEAYVFVNPNDLKLTMPKQYTPIKTTLVPVIGGIGESNVATFMALYLGKLDETMAKNVNFYLHNANTELKPLIHSLCEQGRTCQFNGASVEFPPPRN